MLIKQKLNPEDSISLLFLNPTGKILSAHIKSTIPYYSKVLKALSLSLQWSCRPELKRSCTRLPRWAACRQTPLDSRAQQWRGSAQAGTPIYIIYTVGIAHYHFLMLTATMPFKQVWSAIYNPLQILFFIEIHTYIHAGILTVPWVWVAAVHSGRGSHSTAPLGSTWQ